jgi:hypothetical protein
MAVACASTSVAQRSAAPPAPPGVATPLRPPRRTDVVSATQLRDAFLARAAQAGLALSFVPEVREWTRPSMISWRQEARAVAMPRWEELSDGQRALLERMASPERAHALFDELFRWFLIVHELTHALQDELGAVHRDHAASERSANDVAVAFFREPPESRERLADLDALLEAARGTLPSLADFEDEAALDRYFDAHYDELTRDPARYGAFQVRFILDSLRRIDALHFDETIRHAVAKP